MFGTSKIHPPPEELEKYGKMFFKNCCKRRDKAVASWRVELLLEALSSTGCPMPVERIYCSACDEMAMGMYHSGEHKVRLCMNNIWTQNQYDRTVAHELIHAYDYCRGKVSRKNILHQACTEIRAAALSGDCDFRAEAARGIWKWKNHHKTCVKRRAVSSVAALPVCESKEQAEKAVERVFDTCYEDLKPFPFLR